MFGGVGWCVWLDMIECGCSCREPFAAVGPSRSSLHALLFRKIVFSFLFLGVKTAFFPCDLLNEQYVVYCVLMHEILPRVSIF